MKVFLVSLPCWDTLPSWSICFVHNGTLLSSWNPDIWYKYICADGSLIGFYLNFPYFSLSASSSWVVDCMDPTCSGRGVCVRGECHCSVGWGGTSCETPRATCLDQCSGHGTFLPDTGLCSCDPNWTGHDCSIGNVNGDLLLFFLWFKLCKIFRLRSAKKVLWMCSSEAHAACDWKQRCHSSTT